LQSGFREGKKEPNKASYTPWVIGGILLVGFALIVGYLYRKKEKKFIRF
jgi:hypothetical protein